jgi:hypothetical protein
VLNALLENPDTRALYLFPTKALAQDQLAELHDLATRLDDRFGVFTYDGDTPSDARKSIRERGHIVLTNPDMLHTGIQPHHTKWMRLFENLRYIVIDELHTYRGVFGSHLANVLRLPPIEALRAWMLLFVDYIATKQIIGPALHSLVGGPSKLYEGSRAQIQGAIDALVKRAIKNGDIRRDLDPFDLLRALIGVSHVASGPDWQQSARRLVDILITGSRPIK